jgi:putative phosphoribosyl transferase
MFRDRIEAGRALARSVEQYRDERPVVLGLPRGGVPVAAEVARSLGAPMDVIVVRKLGLPSHPELAMGAIGEAGVRVLNPGVIRSARVSESMIDAVEERERNVLEDRVRALRPHRPRLDIAGRLVIVVDDGLATGATARAAIQVAREHGAARVVLAVPVAAPDTVAALRADADDVVAVETPEQFAAVGQWYEDFSPVSDNEVIRILDAAAQPARAGHEVLIPAGDVTLAGTITAPANPSGVVIFAHGSGSSRHSPRNVAVARVLQEAGFATLLFDLLTDAEAGDRRNVFDVEMLAHRLATATTWVRGQLEFMDIPIGYFGASTGAAAALVAAAEDPKIAAVVSRGGRPDLAGRRLWTVRAPTLLIVGGHDEQVLQLNQQAARELRCVHDVAIVPGATHLFEEPGTLSEAARLAIVWFTRCFEAATHSRPRTISRSQ